MVSFDRIEICERTGVNKTIESKECDVCHYWYFLDKRFKFEPYVYNGCHDVLMMSMKLCNITILNIHGVDYRCITNRIIRSGATNVMQNINLSGKSKKHKNLLFINFKHKNLLSHTKMAEEIITSDNI